VGVNPGAPGEQNEAYEGLVTTLQTRLVFVLMGLLAVVLAVFSTVVYILAGESIRADIDQILLDNAIILGRQVNTVNPARIL
jgi:hypothetical protein